MNEKMYRIMDIKHIGTEETRTDGRYPLRKGSIVKNIFAKAGFCMICEYVKDAQGKPKEGFLRTSKVSSVKLHDGVLTVTTQNSIYIFKEMRAD